MFKFYVIVLLAAASFSTGTPIGCSEDAHCPTGFYCRPDEFLCSECINCTQMKRLPPLLVENECITKFTECGSCYKGLVENLIGADCVPPPSRSILGNLPTYAWAVIALGMLVLGLVVCLAAAYVMRNFNAFKVLACYTRTSVQSDTVPRDHGAGGAPPSYDSLAGAPADSSALEESRPFIQPTEAPVPTRVSDARQAARMFTAPTNINNETNTANIDTTIYQADRQIPSRGQTDSNLSSGQIPSIHQTESNLNSGQIPSRGQTDSNLSSGQIPNKGQTESNLNSSQTAVYPELSLRRLSNKEETI